MDEMMATAAEAIADITDVVLAKTEPPLVPATTGRQK
jgi:hypothetical protein